MKTNYSLKTALWFLLPLLSGCSTLKVQVLDVDTFEPVADAMVFVTSGDMFLLYGARRGIYMTDNKGFVKTKQFGKRFYLAAGKARYWASGGYCPGDISRKTIGFYNDPSVLTEYLWKTNNVITIFIERSENPFFTDDRPNMSRDYCYEEKIKPEVGEDILWNQWEAYKKAMRQTIEHEFQQRNQLKHAIGP